MAIAWLVKASYLVFAISGLMHFSYRLLLRAQIKALNFSISCFFIQLTLSLNTDIRPAYGCSEASYLL